MSELLEKILDKKNMSEAYKKVCANKGTGGVDGMELEELDGYIRENWNSIRERIRERSYKSQPVRRVEIPKPNGRKRKLGIPTVTDRVIQQGIAQVVSPMCEPLFSDHSYGFRPNRSCEMAIKDILKKLTERRKTMAFAERVQQLNWVIRGWINYFAIGSMKKAMYNIDAHLRTRLRVIIWKQWKVPKKRQWGLQKLGIGKDLAKQTSYMGDHYQWIVTKTCVARAISKEKLSQAGLVSCYDYYMERYALKLC